MTLFFGKNSQYVEIYELHRTKKPVYGFSSVKKYILRGIDEKILTKIKKNHAQKIIQKSDVSEKKSLN